MAFKRPERAVKAPKSENRRSLIMKAETEQEVVELKKEAQEDIQKDNNMFFMGSTCDVKECQRIAKVVIKSHEVIETDAFKYGLKFCHEGGIFEEYGEEINLDDYDLPTRKAVIKFCYYASNHALDVRLCNRKLELLKEDYLKDLIGTETELKDYFGE